MTRDFVRLILVCLWALPVGVVLCGSTASAQSRSVRIDALGPNSGPARRAIRSGLEDRGFSAVDEGGDVVITGTARSRGARWLVDLHVSDSGGTEHAAVQMRVSGNRGLRRLVGRLATAIGEVPGGAPPAARADPPPDDEHDEDSDDGDSDHGHSDHGDSDGGDSDGDDSHTPDNPFGGSGSNDDDNGSGSDNDPPLTVIVQIGAGVRSRSVEILSPDGVDGAYRAPVYFEIAARAQATFFDILFVRTWFGSSVALDSEREDPSLGNVDTQFSRWFGDVGVVAPIEEIAIGVAFGVGWDRYELAFNELVPTAEYVHLRPAIVSSFQLGGEAFVLDAEFGMRFPFGVGDLASLHGTAYNVIGFDGTGRFHGVIGPGFTWAVEAGFRHYSITFDRPDGEVRGQDSGWHATGFAGWQFF